MAGEGDYYAWKDAAGACVQRRLDELELRMAKLEGKAGGKKIQGLVLRDLGLASEHALVRELTEERWGDEVALLVMDEDGGCLLRLGVGEARELGKAFVAWADGVEEGRDER